MMRTGSLSRRWMFNSAILRDDATSSVNSVGVERKKEHEKQFSKLIGWYEEHQKNDDRIAASHTIAPSLFEKLQNSWFIQQLVRWGGDVDMKRSYLMNKAILDKMHDVRFYDKTRFGLEKNFQSWFNVGALHMWITLYAMRTKSVDPRSVAQREEYVVVDQHNRRVEPSMPSKYESLSQELNDLYFSYVDDRVDTLLAKHPHRRRYKKQLSNMYMQQILSYDEAMEPGKNFSLALQTNLFNIYATYSDNDVKDDAEIIKEEHIAIMLKYVQTSLKQSSQPSICAPIDGMPVKIPQFVLNPSLHGVLNFANLPEN
jgi:ribosome-associated toxin RatA of RatAB toxin-antitoxin module